MPRGPCVWPSVVGASPVSRRALNRRRSSLTTKLGFVPQENWNVQRERAQLNRGPAHRPGTRLRHWYEAESQTGNARRCAGPAHLLLFRIPANMRAERVLCRPLRRAIIQDPDAGEVCHEARQILEVTQQPVGFGCASVAPEDSGCYLFEACA
jgi:hypothetical protein